MRGIGVIMEGMKYELSLSGLVSDLLCCWISSAFAKTLACMFFLTTGLQKKPEHVHVIMTISLKTCLSG